jgi:hypothetical protein
VNNVRALLRANPIVKIVNGSVIRCLHRREDDDTSGDNTSVAGATSDARLEVLEWIVVLF